MLGRSEHWGAVEEEDPTHSKLRCTVIAKQDKGRFVFGDRVLLFVQVGLELRILLLQPSQRWVTGVYYYAQTKFSNIE